MLDKVRPKPDQHRSTVTHAAPTGGAVQIQKDVLTVISIVRSPNPYLNQVCDPVRHLGDKNLKKLAKQMAKAMYDDGCGLAAPRSAWRSGSW